MIAADEQATELEVLRSIFDGDQRFSVIANNKFQYKFGEDDHYRSFLLEIDWPKTYPETLPRINMDLFYNKHLLPEVKERILLKLKQEAESYLGMAATFSLIEYVKENFDDLVKDQIESATMAEEASNVKLSNSETDTEDPKKVNSVNKVQMSKAQKRRMWDRTDASKLGQAERGWNWVDILGHLAQTS
uniref:RWD domain-containing protein n=1 Tax=Parascaris univalens TaxID=6257 RepID=A0A915CFQ9_PARUN